MVSNEKTPSPVELETATGNGAGDGVDSDIDYKHCMSKVRSFREWCRLNPERVKDLEEYALNEAQHGRRFAIKTIIERIRWFDYVTAEGQPVKISNDYAPLFARVLIRKYPQLEKFIETRPSMFDKVRI